MELELLCASLPYVHNILFNTLNEKSYEDDELEFKISCLSNKIKKMKNVPSRIVFLHEITVINSSAKEFQSHFRINRETFQWPLARISPQLDSSRIACRQTIIKEKQLLSVYFRKRVNCALGPVDTSKIGNTNRQEVTW